MTTVPVKAGEITPAWLHTLLGPEGWPRVEAVRTDRLPGANPKVTQVYRAHLSFSAGAAAPAQTVIVKVPAEDPGHRSRHAAGHVYEREIGVYRLLKAEQGASMARLYAAECDHRTGMGAMVIEDLGASAPSDGLVPPGSAGPVVEYLARLHAGFWESPGLAATVWLRGTKNLDLWGDPPDLYSPGWRRLSKRRDIGDRLRRVGDALVTRLPVVLAELERRPRTLVHADLHPGNLMWRPGSSVPVGIDWQGAAFAGCTSDIAKLFLHLRPGELVEQEERLLRRYHGLIEQAGVAGYPFGRFERDYRLAQAAIFANYAIISPPAKAAEDLAIGASMGRSLRAVSAAIGAVFPDAFDWP